MGKVGRPILPFREAYKKRFGLTDRAAKKLDDKFIFQLSCCKTDEARRLILNVSEMADES